MKRPTRRAHVTKDQEDASRKELSEPPLRTHYYDDDENKKKQRKPLRYTPWIQRNDLRMFAIGVLVFLQVCCWYIQRNPELQQMNENRTRGVSSPIRQNDFSIIFGLFANHSIAFMEPGSLDEEARKRATSANFGDLDVRFFQYDGEHRAIYYNEREDWGYDELMYWDAATGEEQEDNDFDYYYAFDDDEARNPMIAYDDDTIQDEKHCRRTSWHRDLHVNCNKLHEFDVQDGFRKGDTSFLA